MRTVSITTRASQGQALNFQQMDANLTAIQQAIQLISQDVDNLGVYVTLEQAGAVGDGVNYAADTQALQILSQIPNAVIVGDPRKTYYFAQGVSNAAGVRYRTVRFKIKHGPGGFSSVDFGMNTRYDTSHCLLHWNQVNGGGLEDCEFFGDGGGGGDYVCLPVAVRGGMSSKPFVLKGLIHVHDLVCITGGVSVHSMGMSMQATGSIMLFENLGTTKCAGAANTYGPDGYWTNNGSLGANDFPQITGFISDTDLISNTPSARIQLGSVISRNIYLEGQARAKHADQTDGVTLGGTGANQTGAVIELIDSDGCAEPLDCQQANVIVKALRAKRCQTGLKVVHAGPNIHVGTVHVEKCSLNAVVLSGSSASAAHDVDNLTVESVTGSDMGGYVTESGNCSASGSTVNNVVLGTYSSPYSGIDYYYCPKGIGAIWITGGTNAGLVRMFSGYNGTTKTLTGLTDIYSGVASPLPVPCDATSTYEITPFGEISAVSFQNDGSTSKITNSTVSGIAVKDTLNRMSNIVRGNQTDVTRNNRAIVARDLGYIRAFASVPTTGPLRVRLAAESPMCQMTLSGDQTIASTSPQQVLFANKRIDTYDIPGSQGVQGSASENGIRVRSPGIKAFGVKIGYLSWTAGESCTVSLLRNGSVIYSKTFSSQSSGAFNCDASWDVPHNESTKDQRAGGNENLYTVQVQHSAATSHTISSSTGTCTTEFTVRG